MKKNRESILLQFFKDNKIKLTHNKKIGHYRVDFIYSLTKYDIIIECDEWNHTDKYIYDEFHRMIHIREITGRHTVFLRFSPDIICKIRGKLIYKTQNDVFIARLKNLLTIFNKIIEVNPQSISTSLIIAYVNYYRYVPFVVYKYPFNNIRTFIESLPIFTNKDINVRDKTTVISKKLNISKGMLNHLLSSLLYILK